MLRSLPEWFELERPLRDLVEVARAMPTFVAKDESIAVGFATLRPQTRDTIEIIAMGVMPDRHRHGIGRALVEAASRFALSKGARLLYVKTLGPSHPSLEYARTRAFLRVPRLHPDRGDDCNLG